MTDRPDLLQQAEWYQLDANPYWARKVRRERALRWLDAVAKGAALAAAASALVGAVVLAVLAR